jgi:hypothetical protein
MPKDVFTDPDDEKERDDDKGPLERFQQQVKDLTDDTEVHMERDDTGTEVAVVSTTRSANAARCARRTSVCGGRARR